jgi:Mrp family chromosome partitioning ATPase
LPERLEFERAIAQWKTRYRLVLIMGPSLDQPQVASIARHCQGSYLVLRLGQSTAGSAKQAAAALRAAAGCLLGCILVDC